MLSPLGLWFGGTQMIIALVWPVVALGIEANPQPQIAYPPLLVQMTPETQQQEAEALYQAGVALFQQGTASSLTEAIIKFEAAIPIWQTLGQQYEQASTLKYIGDSYSLLEEPQKSLDYYQKTLNIIATIDKQPADTDQLATLEASTLFGISIIYLKELQDKPQALNFMREYLRVNQPNEQLISAIEFFFGGYGNLLAEEDITSQLLIADFQEIEMLFYQALGNPVHIASQLHLLGSSYFFGLAEWQKGLDHVNQSLAMYRQLSDRHGEANVMISLGSMYQRIGDLERALAAYSQALSFFKSSESDDDSSPLNVANLQYFMGEIYYQIPDYQTAFSVYQQALNTTQNLLSINPNDRDILRLQTSIISSLGLVYQALKNYPQALTYHQQALELSKTVNDIYVVAFIFHNLGEVYAQLGDHPKALEYYNRALPIFRQAGLLDRETYTLYNIAQVERLDNHLNSAVANIKTAINIIENLRAKIGSQELRQTYFASVQNYYQLYIDLLMELHQQQPNQGYDAQALQASERSRARSLLELLTEANANIRQGIDPQLLAQEQQLQQQLNALEYQRYQLTRGQYTQTQLENLKQQTDNTLNQLRELSSQIRRTSPRYADLQYPQPLTLSEIQKQVLDENTLLLQYALGEQQSYLWAVDKTGITSYILRSRSEIEKAAQTFTDSLKTMTTSLEPGQPLSQIVLGPVADKLANQRLLIVGDGVLQSVPFAALPLPNQPNTPLLSENEIITLPSTSTVALQRRHLQNRPPVAKKLAVIADPVFGIDDPRLAGQLASTTLDSSRDSALTRAARNLGLGDAGPVLNRLPFTAKEAQTILSLVPESERRQALGFEASRLTITNPELSQYQIVHFATHGLIDPINPELSGVVLSLYDQRGQVQDGFLRLHDIFNLNLPAELVVLSACETGLGRSVRGEGLVGLTRGFMYAGARRVVVSLWSVSDVGTSEVMSRFYYRMFNGGETPAAALRAAQLEMWNSDQWKSPYYWAAFTIQGDW
ncbi:MAG: CHAT domain-containing protein [Arthrospira sp. SH-MAG29]|nr:CHAT domain-containing tetratricopeptide repeat protein [Arthrospira sp. SH-MAG29]MBS0015748.1 CHAT domain-containing protein [Arthrospira sp. SH-MAG29]